MIKRYKLDSIKTILQREARDRKTIPEFLAFENNEIVYLPDKILFEPKGNFSSINYSRILEQALEENDDIRSTPEKFIGAILLDFEIKNPTLPILLPIYKNRRVINIREIERNKNLADSIEENFRRYENIIPMKSSEIILKKKILQYKVNLEEQSLFFLFDSLILHENAPIASYNGFYKLYTKDLDVDSDVDFGSDEDYVFLKVEDRIVLFAILEGQVFLNIEAEKESILEYVASCFQNKNTINKEYDTVDLTISFKVNIKVNLDILSDIIMNYTMFRNTIIVNDNRERIFNSIGYITVINPEKDIRSRISSIKDETTNITIYKSQSNEDSNFLKEVLLKLFTFYSIESKNITKEYKNLYPKFREFDEKIIKEKKVHKNVLKQQIPELFLVEYPKSCRYQPVIAESQKEVDEARDREKRVILFPKDPHPIIPQKNYYCPTDYKPYIGLRKNDLKNKNIISYLPCCYGKDPFNIKGSPTRVYYYGDEKRKETKGVGLIETNKFVEPGKKGVVPSYFEDLFPKQDIFRVGTKRSKTSFLTCINILLDQDETPEDYNHDPNEFMDARHYAPIVEKRYDCNIVLFDETGVLLPEHKMYFIKKVRKEKPIFFLYQHLGAYKDHAEYPQCEYIIGIKERNFSFKNLYDYTSKTFVPPLFQYLDLYDKVIAVEYTEGDITRVFPPIPKFEDVPIKTLLESSNYKKYIETKRIADYLVQLCSWIFVEKGEISFLIKNNHTYDIKDIKTFFRRVFEKNSSFIENESVIVTSKTMKTKLLYNARRNVRQKSNIFKEWTKRKNNIVVKKLYPSFKPIEVYEKIFDNESAYFMRRYGRLYRVMFSFVDLGIEGIYLTVKSFFGLDNLPEFEFLFQDKYRVEGEKVFSIPIEVEILKNGKKYAIIVDLETKRIR